MQKLLNIQVLKSLDTRLQCVLSKIIKEAILNYVNIKWVQLHMRLHINIA